MGAIPLTGGTDRVFAPSILSAGANGPSQARVRLASILAEPPQGGAEKDWHSPRFVC